ncbi:M-phase phosphoprotein 6 [Papilio machaon]|uniref:M-phase phosphoprotein 6 n=1 Tax=Papilio machaon TaxID=76193 RepID=A0A194RBD6_PAPMA|nr:M-phase phosphoprotein 6 [Papilio machaon]
MSQVSMKKLQLPKSVLDMKFMKRSKDRIERELENTKGHEELYSNIITNEMRSATGNYVSEASFIYCEDLLEGRLSFKGMNPEIERLMELENAVKKGYGDMKKDVSDEDLLRNVEKLRKRKSETTPPSQYVFKKQKTR